MKSIRDYTSRDKIYVAAHRGSSGTAPENTLAAIKEAIEAGAMMIEIDAQLTADGYLAVYHDLTKICGAKKNERYRWDELKSLDAGSWYDAKYKGEKIPLLSEALEFVKEKAYLIIEIKSHNYGSYTEYADKIVEEVKSLNMQDYILFASFDYDTLKRIKSIDSSLPTAAIKLPGDPRPPSEIVKETGCEAYICSLAEMNKEMYKDIKANNIFSGLYAIDSIESLCKALEYEVNTIGTNYPAMIVEELKKKGKI
jgi:glycerophosphoryl diester phosphodiesterase